MVDHREDITLAPEVNHPPDGLGELVAGLASQIEAVGEKQSTILSETEQLKLERRILTEMHDQCRALREELHEREFLLPVFLSLIDLADRCRQETRRLSSLLRGYAREAHLDVALSIRHVVEARKADLVEIEAILARFGVEGFQHPNNLFDPRLQTNIKPVESPKSELNGVIAARLLLGYRRNGKTIRPERVRVYVFTHHLGNHHQDKGD